MSSFSLATSPPYLNCSSEWLPSQPSNETDVLLLQLKLFQAKVRHYAAAYPAIVSAEGGMNRAVVEEATTLLEVCGVFNYIYAAASVISLGCAVVAVISMSFDLLFRIYTALNSCQKRRRKQGEKGGKIGSRRTRQTGDGGEKGVALLANAPPDTFSDSSRSAIRSPHRSDSMQDESRSEEGVSPVKELSERKNKGGMTARMRRLLLPLYLPFFVFGSLTFTPAYSLSMSQRRRKAARKCGMNTDGSAEGDDELCEMSQIGNQRDAGRQRKAELKPAAIRVAVRARFLATATLAILVPFSDMCFTFSSTAIQGGVIAPLSEVEAMSMLGLAVNVNAANATTRQRVSEMGGEELAAMRTALNLSAAVSDLPSLAVFGANKIAFLDSPDCVIAVGTALAFPAVAYQLLLALWVSFFSIYVARLFKERDWLEYMLARSCALRLSYAEMRLMYAGVSIAISFVGVFIVVSSWGVYTASKSSGSLVNVLKPYGGDAPPPVEASIVMWDEYLLINAIASPFSLFVTACAGSLWVSFCLVLFVFGRHLKKLRKSLLLHTLEEAKRDVMKTRREVFNVFRNFRLGLLFNAAFCLITLASAAALVVRFGGVFSGGVEAIFSMNLVFLSLIAVTPLLSCAYLTLLYSNITLSLDEVGEIQSGEVGGGIEGTNGKAHKNAEKVGTVACEKQTSKEREAVGEREVEEINVNNTILRENMRDAMIAKAFIASTPLQLTLYGVAIDFKLFVKVVSLFATFLIFFSSGNYPAHLLSSA